MECACPACGLKFSSDDGLQRHVLDFHKTQNEESIKYQCTACKKTWSNFKTLKKHQLTCGVQAGTSGSASGYSGESTDVSKSAVPVDEDSSFLLDHDDSLDCGPSETDPFNKSYEDCLTSLQEELQDEVVQLLCDLKDSNATQNTINKVVVGVDKIKTMVLSICVKLLQEKAGVSEVLTLSEAVETLEDLKTMSVFDKLAQPDEFLDYLETYEGLVKPVKVVLQQQQEIVNQKLVVKDKDFFYQVPFLPQLEELLNCTDVLKCIDNPEKNDQWTYTTITDGIAYRKHPVVLKYKDSESEGPPLCVILYHDGIDPSDTASARSGKNNMVFFYWTLGNIHPKYRSAIKAIQLYAIVKSTDLKKYGYAPIMNNLIKAINVLSSTGVSFNLKTQKRLFHGFLECSLGDYPAQAALGGFKMSVTAEKPCRECYVSNEENYIDISDFSKFQLRDIEQHKKHLEEITTYEKLTRKEQSSLKDPSVTFGINERSVLLDIQHFNVTKNMPQDFMHVANEGVLAYMCHSILRHVIVDQKKIALARVNDNIGQLSNAFPADRPGVIKEEHLAPAHTLRQSSAQMRVLSLLLPFALHVQAADGSLQFAGDAKYLKCFIKFSQIMNFCLAYKFHVTDVELLRAKIQEFHEDLILIDPTVNKAKLHFLHHIPDQIILYGGIRQVACYRFEGHHSIFKRHFKIIHNYKNPMLSLALHHQIRKCNQMRKENFLYDGHEYTTKMDVTNLVDRHVAAVKQSFPTALQIIEISRLKVYRTVYKEGSLILLADDEPEFGVIKKMYSIGNKKFCFVCLKAKTRSLVKEVNAYQISTMSTLLTVDVDQLKYPHPIVKLVWYGRDFAMPLGHRKLLAGTS
ncbi:Zinc finger protein SNAI1 [Frankliniella fusca]|uniref:Zinc finger protein SNAI1 n=1 Tax=Frankliniella fusca TaxID=407009 RepID=A0AAE1HD80_9NEOP|nr:Zinc finger protein SNAI1 [Frankliniella fusca]